ncbi:MAG: FtsX-like permease family protein, partial [Chloroflexota bacterium]
MIVRRAAADWLILFAAIVTILLATVLLAAGPIYADAVTLSGARQTLRDSDTTEANVEISILAREQDVAGLYDEVSETIARTFALTGGISLRHGESESYALPDQPEDEVEDLAIFRFIDQLDENTTLADGRWPEPSDEPYETAISQAAADLLELEVGDELTLTNRRDEDVQPTIQVVGIFDINDPSDPYWYENELDTTGINEGSSFTTYGPFFAHPTTFFGDLTPASADLAWRIYPTVDNLEVDEIADMRRRVQALEGTLNDGRPAGNRFQVETGLVGILSETERSLLVTRSGVLILIVQLAILSGYALLLTARLLASERQIETNLLRARGAGNRQIMMMALMEGLLLGIPAAIASPWIAALVLRLFNQVGPLASIGLEIDPVVSREAFILSAIAALGAILALVIPAYNSSRAFEHPRADRGREESRGIAQRAGIDIALLVVAAIALWQLRRFGAPITETVEGRLGVDPLLVSAPALGLLAGAVAALRTIPLMARIAERITTRSDGAIPVLSAWQVARRPMRYARSALLLMLAIGIGLFAVSYSETWRVSQADQAAFQIGADLRVRPDPRVHSGMPPLYNQSAYERLPGYVNSMPVARDFGVLSQSAGSGRYISLDASRADDIVAFRSDLASESFTDLMDSLFSRRPDLATLELPGEPETLRIAASFQLDELTEAQEEAAVGIEEGRRDFSPQMRLIIQDANGQLHRLDLGSLGEDGEVVEFERALTFPTGDGDEITPSYPLSLVAIEVRGSAPQLINRSGVLEIQAFEVAGEPGGEWQSVDTGFNAEDWVAEPEDLPLAYESPSMTYRGDDGDAWEMESGAIQNDTPLPVDFSIRPAGSDVPETLPVVVSEDFLRENEVEVGDELQLGGLPRITGDAVIVGAVEEFPTVEPDRGEAVVVDFQTLSAMAFVPGQALLGADEWWIDVEGDGEQAAAMLNDGPYFSAEVNSREDRETTLASDPVALGTIGALSLGFVAAAIFASVGFVVSATVSVRERLGEFALLRAVGLSPRQLAGWLSLEHGILVLVSIVGGTALGLVISWVILPLISITQEAAEAVPGVLVRIPWLSILWLELSVIAVLLISVGIMVLL